MVFIDSREFNFQNLIILETAMLGSQNWQSRYVADEVQAWVQERNAVKALRWKCKIMPEQTPDAILNFEN